jgi:hypothetical protein
MLKAKMMSIFKDMFGGSYSKKDGKIFWSKDGFKELVTIGFLKHFIDKKKDPSVSDTVKPAPKKVKKDAKVATNPEVPEGS